MEPPQDVDAFRDGNPTNHTTAEAYHNGVPDAEKYFQGFYKCKGMSCCQGLPGTMYFIPCCGGCCLWGIWGILGLPCPALSCVTFCMCKEGTHYITQKAGITTGDLFVVDSKKKTLAYYSMGAHDEPSCYCVK
ncbi:hypothetical protein CYMTET_20996 [Cymbomonas tetramitiformis]|uniref:Uncharacterized protein n=1 Tax=Cymbomonas tetramitiformis TaxID=36881 RepID=A0AAE0F8D7_9CHLO|nr:hypothetical protein CYMTET_35885 [Cymbomonas tetramitiformis]KAK3270611.1 hypothetical protein CYMTET_20996 [Cymbomonas tetramitiformis]|eukprot:gene2627-3391_t